MTYKAATKFAEEWLAGWNNHDLEAITAHYAADIVLISPMVVKVLGDKSGLVQGKEKLREYFAKGLAAFPDLHFDLQAVFCGVAGLTLLYTGVGGRRVAEVLVFDQNSLIKQALVYYENLED